MNTANAPAAEKAPVKPKVAGQPRDLAPLGMPEIGQLRIWTKSQQPNPIEAIKPHLDGLDTDVQKALLNAALEELRKPVAFGSPEFHGALQTGEGFREVLWLSLKRAGSQVAREASDAAADAMSLEEAADVIAVAFGS